MSRTAAYEAYLKSERFRWLRTEAIKRDGGACRICGGTRRLQAHHRRYPTSWDRDALDNLTTLCDACHDLHHHNGRLPKQHAERWDVMADPKSVINGERKRILTAILLRHPVLLRDVEHAYLGIDLPRPLATLRTALLEWAEAAEILDSQGLLTHLTNSGLKHEADQALARAPVPLPACAMAAAMPAEAAAGWWHIFGFLHVQRLGEEIALAEFACAQDVTSQSQNRLYVLKAALNKVNSGAPDVVDLAA